GADGGLQRARQGGGLRGRPAHHGAPSGRRARRRGARRGPRQPRRAARLSRAVAGGEVSSVGVQSGERALLEVSHVDTYYGDSHVLFDLSLAVKAGEVVCLLGRNGAGNTTPVPPMLCLAPRRSGRVARRGRDLRGLPPFRVARLGIGFVPEDRRVFPNLTVHENIEVARRPRPDGPPGPWSEERVFDLFPVL